jgi:hypothetical protein
MKAHRRTTIAGGVAFGLLLLYMLAAAPLAAHLIAGRASEKLGRAVTIGGGHGALGAIVLGDVAVAGASGRPPLLTVKEVRIPWGAALGMHSDVRVDGLRISAVKGGAADNVSEIIDRLRGRSGAKAKAKTDAKTDADTGDSGGAPSSSLPDVVITNGSVDARDESKHVALRVGLFEAELRPNTKLAVRLRGIRGVLTLGADGEGPSFAADEIDVQTPLAGLRPKGVP